MFGKRFGRKPGNPPPRDDAAGHSAPTQTDAPPNATQHPAVTAMLRTIADRRADDPLIGAKVAGKDVFHHLMRILNDERGVHAETLLTALGALAGFSCQMGIRAEYASRPDDPLPFHVLTGADGRIFYFGDALNTPLAESRYSIWSLCAGTAQSFGATLPDLNEIYSHVAGTCGTSGFGVPRYPGEGRAGDLPINYIKAFWPILQPTVRTYCTSPSEWHIAYGLAIQDAIELAKTAIDPGAATKIVMESAIPMAKIDQREVGLSNDAAI